MAQSVNILLTLPPRGGSAGVWDTPVNGNFNSLDGYFGGVQSISVSGSTTLTCPSGTATPGGGPTQAENMALVFSGTLSAAATITLPLPGKYVLRNNCLGSALIMRAMGTGNVVGLPPGEAIEVYNDGTNADFVGLGRVGSYMDLAVSTTPAWMTACTVLPYLVADGQTYSSASYTALGIVLGSTFGGNGITTFGVPDVRSRYRIPLDFSVSGSTAGRINATTGGAGFDGTVLGTSGGSQFLQTHSHALGSQTATVSFQFTTPGFGSGGSGAVTNLGTTFQQTSVFPISTGIIAASGSGSSGNIPPGIVAGICFIKT